MGSNDFCHMCGAPSLIKIIHGLKQAKHLIDFDKYTIINFQKYTNQYNEWEHWKSDM